MRDDVKVYLLLIALALALFAAWNNHGIEHGHKAFFSDMRQFRATTEAFMSAGGRNTSVQGKALCERINELEKDSGKVPRDCAALYE